MNNKRPIKDLYLASIFVVKGHQVLEVEFRDKSFVFLFEADEVRATENAYWAGTLQLENAKAFTDVIRDMKGRMRTLTDKPRS